MLCIKRQVISGAVDLRVDIEIDDLNRVITFGANCIMTHLAFAFLIPRIPLACRSVEHGWRPQSEGFIFPGVQFENVHALASHLVSCWYTNNHVNTRAQSNPIVAPARWRAKAHGVGSRNWAPLKGAPSE